VVTRYELYGGPGGTIEERRVDVLVERFPETRVDLELRNGRPRQLPWKQLREQVRRREQAGQPAREYELAIAERLAAPLQIVPAALAALALAFGLQRPRRRMPVAGAVALGMGLSMALWAASVIAHAVAMSGALEPWMASSIPGALSFVGAAVALRRG
jgi:lipopolysaccharide export LptBFGC system permease protein LptF